MQPNEVVGLSNDVRTAGLDMGAHKGIVVLREGWWNQDVDVLATEPARHEVQINEEAMNNV